MCSYLSGGSANTSEPCWTCTTTHTPAKNHCCWKCCVNHMLIKDNVMNPPFKHTLLKNGFDHGTPYPPFPSPLKVKC